MPRMTKQKVIDELNALGIPVDAGEKYNHLCSLLKHALAGNPPEEKPKQIKIVNRLKKRNTFLADAVRDQRDTEFLHKEIGKREYKGRLLRVTTVKEYVVSADGYWETAFTIELKE